MDNIELIEIAKKARENAKPMESNFRVGAALLTKQGKIYTGCNIDDLQCLKMGICAERLAFLKAIEAGEKDFDKIAVVGGETELIMTMPCGICRQFMIGFAPDITVVYLDDNKNICEINIKELLPFSFDEKFNER